ncbi:hypothetical protein FQA39_LY04187 [Lamprigera yunnana]|nr:hypothetical protein FQA39_LY04187 [Lamprigera yunnana]
MVLIKKKRNVWSSEEVIFFLRLVNEKHIVGLRDGKQLRVGDIFKTLVAPMEQAGIHRDVGQLTIKWKNLKAMEDDDARISLEMYDDVPDIDGAIRGGSTTPGIQKQAATTPSGSRSIFHLKYYFQY